MKRFFTFTLILLLIAVVFFYLGYEPALSEVDVTGSLFGYTIQTSKYTLVGVFISLFVMISSFLRFFIGIKNIYRAIIGFFSGRSKDKATENLLTAYAFLIGNRPKTAQNYLKKAEKYFKETPHTSLISLVIEQANNAIRPTSKPLAVVENDKILKPVGAYIEASFPISQQDDNRMLELLNKAHSFNETPCDLYAYIQILIQNEKFDDAEAILKSVRGTLSEDIYKFHLSSLYILKSTFAHHAKQPDQMLAYGLEALKHDKYNLVALHLVIQAYKTLQRDNKAIRIFNDCFSHIAQLGHVKLFFELKGIESLDETEKRIASLPRSSENSEAYIALKAYHFAMGRDFISLNTLIHNANNYHDSLWFKAARLCIVVEKDILLSTEAVKIFKEALYVAFHQQVTDIYSEQENGKIYLDYLISHNILPNITSKEVCAKLSLFKDMLKSVPVLHQKIENYNHDSLDKPDLHKLEANIYPKS